MKTQYFERRNHLAGTTVYCTKCGRIAKMSYHCDHCESERLAILREKLREVLVESAVGVDDSYGGLYNVVFIDDADDINSLIDKLIPLYRL